MDHSSVPKEPTDGSVYMYSQLYGCSEGQYNVEHRSAVVWQCEHMHCMTLQQCAKVTVRRSLAAQSAQQIVQHCCMKICTSSANVEYHGVHRYDRHHATAAAATALCV
jgi:hypothetical protein